MLTRKQEYTSLMKAARSLPGVYNIFYSPEDSIDSKIWPDYYDDELYIHFTRRSIAWSPENNGY